MLLYLCMQSIIVKKGGIRLDKFLQSEYETLSFNLLQRFLKENKIKVNSKKIPLNTILNTGDKITLFILDKYLTKQDTSLDKSSIVYEDDLIAIVNKPQGLITIDDDPSLDTLDSRIKAYLNSTDGTVCHRLDTGTSGLVIYAKNTLAKDIIEDAIKHRNIHKHYVCATFGWPKPESGKIEDYLLKDDKGFVKAFDKQVDGSKEAITIYKTIKTNNELALVDVEILTGRTHQIRVHMKKLGCPILGDSKYGIEIANRKYKKNRQCLCAYKIVFSEMPNELAYLSNKEFSIPKPNFNLF